MTSFRWEAVVRCASRKIVDTWFRSSLSSVSSGTSILGEENLEVVDAREFSVCRDDLCETAADVRDDRAVDTRPGIVKVFLEGFRGTIRTGIIYLFVRSSLQAELK